MQIAAYTSDSYHFYCPVTGQQIVGDGIGYLPSPATKGYWINEIRDEPVIEDDLLTNAWKDWLKSSDVEDGLVGPQDFLKDYPAENWIAFELHMEGMPGDIAWIIIDMSHV